MTALDVLVSLGFWALFLVTSPFAAAVGALVWAVTVLFDPGRRVLHAYLCAWTFGLLRVNPLWKVSVVGRENLPPGPSILVVNHQSMADVVVTMGLRHPFKYVSKSSLFKVPLVGWMMWLARYVSVERGKPRSTQRMLEGCRKHLKAGMAVLIFPEGTYSGGTKMLPFKRGAFLLALTEKVPLVPVAVHGTARLIRGDGPMLHARCEVLVRVLPAVMPLEGEATEALSTRVRGMLEEELGRGQVQA